MPVLTIPKKITNGRDLVIIPREEYEGLLDLKKAMPKKALPKDQAWFWTKKWQKKEREADEDIKKGRVCGPFTNAKDLIKSLKSKK